MGKKLGVVRQKIKGKNLGNIRWHPIAGDEEDR